MARPSTMAIMSIANGRRRSRASGSCASRHSQDRVAVAVVEGGDAFAQHGLAPGVRQELEERLEALGVGGDARLAVDERVDALLAGRQGAGLLR